MKLILKWVFGVFLIMGGLGALTSQGFISGFFFLMSGLICIPPTFNFMQSKLNWKPGSSLKYALVIIFFIIGIIATPESIKNSKNPNNTTTQSSDKPNERIKQSVSVDYNKIGDIVKVGNFEYNVKNIKFKKELGNQFTNKTADGIFLIVSMSITNVSSESCTIDNSLFKLYDESGTEYDFSQEGTTASMMSNEKTLFLKQCHPNIPTTGSLVFEVPNKAVYDLKLSGGIWSGKTAIIKLTE